MKKYIAYARKYVHPKLNPDACKIVQDFYIQLRENHQRSDATPMTTRQLGKSNYQNKISSLDGAC